MLGPDWRWSACDFSLHRAWRCALLAAAVTLAALTGGLGISPQQLSGHLEAGATTGLGGRCTRIGGLTQWVRDHPHVSVSSGNGHSLGQVDDGYLHVLALPHC